jgi:MraZ protein
VDQSGYKRSEAALSEFIGSRTFSVSKKGRLHIPAALRQDLAVTAGSTFVVLRGPDGCLDAYPSEEWERRLKVLRSIPNKRKGRFYKRLILSVAAKCKVDANNRILIPPELLRNVGIEDQVLIIGQLDHLELWSPEAHRAYLEGQDVTLEDALEEVEERVDRNGSPWQE